MEKVAVWIKDSDDITVIENNALKAGAIVDLTATFTEHENIIPKFVLIGTGWFSGGVEVRTITKNSITVRLLNGTGVACGGYATFQLFFIK